MINTSPLYAAEKQKEVKREGGRQKERWKSVIHEAGRVSVCVSECMLYVLVWQ